MAETKAARLSRLGDEIGYELGGGSFPENKLREFRFLWGTTPNHEKDGLSVSLRDIETMVDKFRKEISQVANEGKLKRYNIKPQATSA